MSSISLTHDPAAYAAFAGYAAVWVLCVCSIVFHARRRQWGLFGFTVAFTAGLVIFTVYKVWQAVTAYGH